ncbi:MAG: box helicase, partial [Paenibacillus sp.]|nr:box helicase [Paenibacillus sp.]
MKLFSEFGLDSKVVRAITEMGFEESTPIQEKTIPLALEGKDLIGQAQTGTGKTAAFGIPLINRIE